MTERGGSDRVAGFAFTIAVFAVCLAASAVAEDESLSKLLSDLRLSADQAANYLAIATPAEGGEKRLVRWEQAEVTLGIVASAGVTAQMIDQAVSQIGNEFDYVGRRLDACIRRWERSADASGDPTRASACDSQPTQIDLLIDISGRSILENIEQASLPSDLTAIDLRAIWQKIRGAVLAKPTASICTAGLTAVADANGQRLAGGAAIIRPAPEQNALLTTSLCARDLGYKLLGSVPIPLADGEGAVLHGSLSKLLYSPEFRSGESQSEVLAKLRTASSN